MRALITACLMVSSVAPLTAVAQMVSVEGVAPIINGDTDAAREAAIRNALGDAARQAGTEVRAVSESRDGRIAFDQTTLRAWTRVERHEVIMEQTEGELYRVLIMAELTPATADPSAARCDRHHLNRLLIGGFPLTRPEQLLPGELAGYAHLSGREIAARMRSATSDTNAAQVLADHRGSLMLRIQFPEHAGTDVPIDAQTWSQVRNAAEQHRAQYVLVGQFISFALDRGQRQRELELDVVLLDAYSATCVARKRFARSISGSVVLPDTLVFGSAAHLDSDLGRAYARLMDEVAAWAEQTARCQPLGARVIDVSNGRVRIDVGSEQGVRVGDSFSAISSMGAPLTTRAGEVLGMERVMLGEARVTSVYPRFAVMEMVGSGALPQSGDQMYSY